jgi:hypothetical protein
MGKALLASSSEEDAAKMAEDARVRAMKTTPINSTPTQGTFQKVAAAPVQAGAPNAITTPNAAAPQTVTQASTIAQPNAMSYRNFNPFPTPQGAPV